MNVITDISITLDADQVLRGQGSDPKRSRGDVREVAASILNEAHSLIEPIGLYDLVSVRDFAHNRITVETDTRAGGAHFEGELVAQALAGAEELALAGCTIGPALEERVAEYFSTGDALRALALDGAGTAAVSALSRQIDARICYETEQRGLQTGMRASPGQEEWPIEQQRVLFDLLPMKGIGVELSDSCLMIPRKSVTFVIGVGTDMGNEHVACDFCSKREYCQWQKRKAVQ